MHWTTAALVGILIATGACLYLGQLEALVGRRELVRNIHVAAGLSLPVPLILGLLTRGRADCAATCAASTAGASTIDAGGDGSSGRASQLGKFNPGQKLNATFLGGALVVMMMSGSIMRFFAPFPDSWRTGATSVHDWFALGIGLSVIGHIMFATRDPIAMRAMRSGLVPEVWARTQRPAGTKRSVLSGRARKLRPPRRLTRRIGRAAKRPTRSRGSARAKQETIRRSRSPIANLVS